jgi:E3 SUMO-protein ligase PIAS1
MVAEVYRYVKEILRSTPLSLEQVDIEPNGKWSAHEEKQQRPKQEPSRSAQSFGYDSDDLIEIQGSHSISLKNEQKAMPEFPSRLLDHSVGMSSQTRTSSLGTAPSSSSALDQNKKRSRETVIDLTLSSDEDDTPPRPVKRRVPSVAFSRIESSRDPIPTEHINSLPPLSPTPPVFQRVYHQSDNDFAR